MSTDTLLLDNLLADVRELAEVLDRQFHDGDMDNQEYGLDLVKAGTYFVETYNGDNSFIVDLKQRLLLYKKLSSRQCRAALNVLRDEHLGIERKRHAQPAPKTQDTRCHVCNKSFDTPKELFDHKEQVHSKTDTRHLAVCDGKHDLQFTTCEQRVAEMEQEAPKPVIENRTSILNLDLSSLPDGRYAVPSLEDESKQFVFLLVRRQRWRQWRDRRYVYGKIITGGEWIEAGTIEVKEWTSDAKELIGEQKPGGVYKGKHEVLLKAILSSPEPWAKLFGQQIGRCCICGKTLTDDVSRELGIGPECERKEEAGYWTGKFNKDFAVHCPICSRLGKPMYHLGRKTDRQTRYKCESINCAYVWDVDFRKQTTDDEEDDS